MGNTSNQGLDPMALARLVQAVNERPQWATSILKSLLGPFAPAPPEQPLTEEQSRMGVTYPAEFQPVADLAALLAGSTRTRAGRAVLGSERGAVGEKPIIAYHGTRAGEFGEFDRGELGFHFGTKEQAATRGPRVMAAELQIKNPLRMPDVKFWGSDTIDELERMGVASPSEAKELTRQYFDDAQIPTNLPTAQRFYLRTKPIRDFIQSKGYDGIVYANEIEGGGDSYIAFSPQQVKPVSNQ